MIDPTAHPFLCNISPHKILEDEANLKLEHTMLQFMMSNSSSWKKMLTKWSVVKSIIVIYWYIYRLFNVNKKKWRPMGHFPNQPLLVINY